jgi:hypothetical protein
MDMKIKELFKYMPEWQIKSDHLSLKDFFHIAEVPVDVIEPFTEGEKPFLNPDDTQNSSPSVRELLALAKRFPGSTVGGYVIPTESGRDDARISLDTIYIKAPGTVATKLKRELKPDEYSYNKETKSYRFWWD